MKWVRPVVFFILFIIIYSIQHTSSGISSQKNPDIKSFHAHGSDFDLHKAKMSNEQCVSKGFIGGFVALHP